LLKELSEFLGKRYGEGFSEVTLQNFIQFYKFTRRQFSRYCLANLKRKKAIIDCRIQK